MKLFIFESLQKTPWRSHYSQPGPNNRWHTVILKLWNCLICFILSVRIIIGNPEVELSQCEFCSLFFLALCFIKAKSTVWTGCRTTVEQNLKWRSTTEHWHVCWSLVVLSSWLFSVKPGLHRVYFNGTSQFPLNAYLWPNEVNPGTLSLRIVNMLHYHYCWVYFTRYKIPNKKFFSLKYIEVEQYMTKWSNLLYYSICKVS